MVYTGLNMGVYWAQYGCILGSEGVYTGLRKGVYWAQRGILGYTMVGYTGLYTMVGILLPVHLPGYTPPTHHARGGYLVTAVSVEVPVEEALGSVSQLIMKNVRVSSLFSSFLWRLVGTSAQSPLLSPGRIKERSDRRRVSTPCITLGCAMLRRKVLIPAPRFIRNVRNVDVAQDGHSPWV